MRHSFFRGPGLRLLSAICVGYTGCTSSGSTGSGTPGFGTNTGNGSPTCPWFGPCASPVSIMAPDGRTYRGRVYPDTTIASDPDAQSVPNPPVAKLEFGGQEVEYFEGACHDDWPQPGARYGIQIFISKEDSSIDASGSLQVYSAPRDGYFASNPSEFPNDSGSPGWAVDLTLTTDGKLTATLSYSGPLAGMTDGPGGAAGASGASGAGGGPEAGVTGGGAGASSRSVDAGSLHATITISGPIAPLCGVPGPDGGVIPAVIPVRDGRVFRLPCHPPAGYCDISKG
jgi:hypothetical protein